MRPLISTAMRVMAKPRLANGCVAVAQARRNVDKLEVGDKLEYATPSTHTN